MNHNLMNEVFVVVVILLFVGVAIAPGISLQSAKVSTDNDLVEVTSQACGIKGFGNTTVKLTEQQYQNLEQYLVEFRARLNQTTTREEAVPIFNDAVVELNKYGLLPKGMSVKEAQKLVLGNYENPRYLRLLDKIQNSYGNNMSDYENYNCLIAGHTTNTVSMGGILTGIQLGALYGYILSYYISIFFAQHHNTMLFLFFAGFYAILMMLYVLNYYVSLLFISNLNPIPVLSVVGLGIDFFNGLWDTYLSANGWIYSNGLNGIKNWSGEIFGDMEDLPIYMSWLGDFFTFFPGIFGFSGIKIFFPVVGSFYLGYAFKLKIVVGYVPNRLDSIDKLLGAKKIPHEILAH